MAGEGQGQENLRIDKWLWYARFFKSRSIASTVCSKGHVRVGGTTVKKPSHPVRPEDTLTFTQGKNIRVIKILMLGERRGPAPEAQLLYEDLAPLTKKDTSDRPPTSESAVRELGAGRPTKKERRDLDKLRGE